MARKYRELDEFDAQPGMPPLLSYVYDLDQQRNVFVAGSLLRHFGFSTPFIEAVSADYFRVLTHETDRPRIAAHHESLRSAEDGVVLNIEYRIRTSSGEWRWLVSRDTPFLRNDAGHVTRILGMAEEIADHSPTDAP